MQGKIITGIGLCIAKEGGMAVSAVWRLVYSLVAYPSKRRITPTGRLSPLQMREDFGADDSKIGLKSSVAQATWQKIVLSRLNRAKDKRDGAKECSVANATEDFHAIFESEFVSDGCSGAPEDRYNAQKCCVAQAVEHFRARERRSMCQFRFKAPLSIANFYATG